MKNGENFALSLGVCSRSPCSASVGPFSRMSDCQTSQTGVRNFRPCTILEDICKRKASFGIICAIYQRHEAIIVWITIH